MERTLAIYIRVSTDEQAESGHSLEQQAEYLVSVAKQFGYHSYQIYKDDGYSAKSLNRPAIGRLLSDIQDGKIFGVLTTKIDRLTRKNKDFSYLLDLFDSYSVFYKAANQNFEVGTASGKLLAQMLSVVAEFEREMIGERVYENLYRMAKNGILPTKPPFGYQLEGGKLVLNPKEADWIRKCAELLLSGHGYRHAAQFLNENGVLTRHGKPWSANSVRTLFENPILIGHLRWNVRKGGGTTRKIRDPSEWIVLENHVPAILTPPEFESIVTMRGRTSQLFPRARRGARLLSGIAKCGFCGGTLHAAWQIYRTQNGEHKHPTYRCGNYAQGRTCKYINRVNADELDAAVIEQIMKLVRTPFDISGLSHQLEGREQKEVLKLQTSLASLDERLQKLVDAYSLGVLTTADLKLAKERLEAARTEKEDRLNKLQKQCADQQQEQSQQKRSAKLEGLLNRLEGSQTARRRVVLELIEEVKVYRPHWSHPAEIEIMFRL